MHICRHCATTTHCNLFWQTCMPIYTQVIYTHKCDSSSECGSIKNSIALHNVASFWNTQFQHITLRVINLYVYVCVNITS